MAPDSMMECKQQENRWYFDNQSYLAKKIMVKTITFVCLVRRSRSLSFVLSDGLWERSCFVSKRAGSQSGENNPPFQGAIPQYVKASRPFPFPTAFPAAFHKHFLKTDSLGVYFCFGQDINSLAT